MITLSNISVLFTACFMLFLVRYFSIYSTAIEIRNNDLLHVGALLSNTYKPSLVSYITTTKQHAEPDDLFIYGILLSSTVVHLAFAFGRNHQILCSSVYVDSNCFYFDFFFCLLPSIEITRKHFQTNGSTHISVYHIKHY